MKGLDIVSFEYKFKQLFANLPLARHAFMTILLVPPTHPSVITKLDFHSSSLKNNLFPSKIIKRVIPR